LGKICNCVLIKTVRVHEVVGVKSDGMFTRLMYELGRSQILRMITVTIFYKATKWILEI